MKELREGDAFNPYRMFVGSMLPEWLERDRVLRPAEKLCYARLARFAGEDGRCFPSLKTLGDAIGVDERTAKRYVKVLKENGLIGAKQRGLGQTNTYTFLVTPLMHQALLIDGGTLEVSELSLRMEQIEHLDEDRPVTPAESGEAHIRESLEESQERDRKEDESIEVEGSIASSKRDAREGTEASTRISTLIHETLRGDRVTQVPKWPNLYSVILNGERVSKSRDYEIRKEIQVLLEALKVPVQAMSKGDQMFVLSEVSTERKRLLDHLTVLVQVLKESDEGEDTSSVLARRFFESCSTGGEDV